MKARVLMRLALSPVVLPFVAVCLVSIAVGALAITALDRLEERARKARG